ncbi:MFS transporter [Streptomyces millisiae]|uniref:MFS transporter n=1 Tax=Streptomyces millisiae TaxID=3075542 RepID=A0ABU2LL16_9ACTN|nr:MFS transporter [Streptomyces sp. DSM 44918]MDT0318280.1 MFS transporter [Streptomyces sp. DSM 44918]
MERAGKQGAMPRAFLVWLAGTRVSLLGGAALFFGLGWAASEHGGRTAALVLTAVTLPRTVLLLVGGALGDRLGPRRVMVVGDAVMLAATLALAVASHRLGTPAWLLVAAAAVVGAVDAFYLPAAGAMPRLLVGREQLPRALAMTQAGTQAAQLLGAPLGAVLVAAAGVTAVALADAASFALVLVVLLCVRPAFDVARAAGEGGVLGEAVEGVRLAAGDRLLRSALLLTMAAAGVLLPVVSLLTPLLVRERGWGAGAAGLVAGAEALGMIAVSLAVSRWGPLRRTGTGAALGLVVAAAGTAGMAGAPVAGAAVACGVVAGAGAGAFAAHIAPLVMGATPDTHLSRIQAVLGLVQSLALVIAHNALGALADAVGAAAATGVSAGAGLLAGLAGLAAGPLRAARSGGGVPRTTPGSGREANVVAPRRP